jgi:hypothetical protein
LLYYGDQVILIVVNFWHGFRGFHGLRPLNITHKPLNVRPYYQGFYQDKFWQVVQRSRYLYEEQGSRNRGQADCFIFFTEGNEGNEGKGVLFGYGIGSHNCDIVSRPNLQFGKDGF